MKVYGVCVHGFWTDEYGRRHEVPYGITGREKLYSKIEDAQKARDEKVIPSCTAWIESSRTSDDVFLRPRNTKYEKDVLIVSILTFYLDE